LICSLSSLFSRYSSLWLPISYLCPGWSQPNGIWCADTQAANIGCQALCHTQYQSPTCYGENFEGPYWTKPLYFEFWSRDFDKYIYIHQHFSKSREILSNIYKLLRISPKSTVVFCPPLIKRHSRFRGISAYFGPPFSAS
jgi:hypothetical protein